MLLQRLSVALFAALGFVVAGLAASSTEAADKPSGQIRVGTFNVDATPPLGSPVAYAAARKIDDPLSARGMVVLGAGDPIVLCAVDWIGIGNTGNQIWREQLAEAAGTTPDRVAVHALHQHDGPRCDFSAEELLASVGLGGRNMDVVFARQTIKKVGEAIREAIANAQPVTHVGIGQAKVDKVASNRRLLGPDGKVSLFRMSSWKIEPRIADRLKKSSDKEGYRLSPFHPEEAMAAPEGVIDPFVKMVSLWNGDQPLLCLTYYACHPQSYFGQGDVTCEFVGIARNQRQEALNGLLHVHFNGAGGNIAAGKYNDGSPELRKVLTARMADGMRRAWEATKKQPLTADAVEWRVAPVQIPPREILVESELEKTLHDENAEYSARSSAARKLSFLRRRKAGIPIDLTCLKLGNAYIVHMPGELFVEYQLAAQKLRPDDFVCMAAYGDYGTGYIGTEIAYSQGGYETSPGVSNTAPSVEKALMGGVKQLLQVKD
jgi:hypothetical protein